MSTLSLKRQVLDLDSRFWIVNTMEMFERLAYYGVRAVIAIYIVLAAEAGGPEFTHTQKGTIFAVWAAVQSLLPMFTGGLADRFGHKNTIALAILFKIAGYWMMGTFVSFQLFLMGCVLLATGTAIFKPGVQGTLAATLKESSASVGWAIFYQLVNFGAFVGITIFGIVREYSWDYVFYGCAAIVAVNFLWLPFYADPSQIGGRAGEAKDDTEAWRELSLAIAPSLAWGWTRLLALTTVASLALPLAWSSALIYGATNTAKAASGLPTPPDGLGPIWTVLWSGSLLAATLLSLGTLRSKLFSGISWQWMAFVAFWIGVLPAWDTTDYNAALSVALYGEGHWLQLAASYAQQVAWVSPMLLLFLLNYVVRKDAYDEGQPDPWSVVVVSVVGIFQHRVLWFCLMFAGFWFMFNQVFDLLPNVIDDWVDTSMLLGAGGKLFGQAWAPPAVAAALALVGGGIVWGVHFLATRWDRPEGGSLLGPQLLLLGSVWGVLILPLVALAFGPWLTLSMATAWMAQYALDNLLALLGITLAAGFGLVALLGVLRVPARVVAWLGLVVGAASAYVAMLDGFRDSAQWLVDAAARGEQVNPEYLININSGLIIFTVVFFGYLSSFMRPLTSIMVGMIVATAGSVVAGTASVGWICVAGIATFSVGEMLSSPKKMEYLATLSKKGQEGLFMGYANVPVAIGWIAGSLMAGSAYDEHGDKVNLAKRHLTDALGVPEATVSQLQKTEVVPFLADKLGTDALGVQKFLFETYHPEQIWLWIGATGLASILGMFIYDRVIRYIDGRKEAAAAA